MIGFTILGWVCIWFVGAYLVLTVSSLWFDHHRDPGPLVCLLAYVGITFVAIGRLAI